MESDIFYSNLINAFLQQGFHFDIEHFSKEEVEDKSVLAICLKVGMTIAKAMIDSPTKHLISTNIHPTFLREDFIHDINKAYSFANLIFYKFVLSQPVLVLAIEADSCNQDKLKSLFEDFDKTVLNFCKHSGTIGMSKLGVTGILLWIYRDSNKNWESCNTTIKELKRYHFLKKTWSISWVINVDQKKVYSHSGTPFLPGIINKNNLENSIFNNLCDTKLKY